MEPTIVIAIITSTTAIAVSIISAYLNSRQQRKSTFKLEALKVIIESDKAEFAEIKARIEQENRIMDRSLEITQKIKDSITMLSHYIAFAEYNLDWLERMKKLIEEFYISYEEEFMKLPPDKRKILHETKATLFTMHSKVLRLISVLKEQNPIDDAKLEELKSMKQVLTDCQQKIIVTKLNTLSKFQIN